MTLPRTLRQNQHRERVECALRKIEVLESKYETVTIGQIVSTRARTHSSVTAVDVFERGERATYSDMERLSNRYAHALRAFGVRKQDRVGVMLPNRIEFPILWFAIAKIGAIIVPINMRYTSREVEYILSDTQAQFAIVDGAALSIFSAMQPWPQSLSAERIILVGEASFRGSALLSELLRGVDSSPVTEDVSPNDLLNIQFTSGTTGFPKGCMLTHDYWGISSYQGICWDNEPHKSYLSAQPFFYGDPQQHLMRSYRQGGTLYLAPQVSSTRFIGWIKQHRIEWCQFPELISRRAEVDDDDGATCLKQTLNWGWSPDSVRRFRSRFGVRTQDAYGMTEIGFGTLMPHQFEDLAETGSVGIVAPFRALRLMNEDGSPTPIGGVGELWVRGRGILSGYWNKPEANAALFEGDWFKTGDLLSRDELGFYWLVGRKKDVIRRSGENIAAREVEAVIREIPEIADVAAVPVSDLQRGEEIKIFVELREGSRVDDLLVQRILEHARVNLASFKVPRYIAFTETLPRTPSSNKVLKRELMAMSDPRAGAYDTNENQWH